MLYLHNFAAMPYLAVTLAAGVGAVLWGIWRGWCGSRKAIWWSGAGTVMTVLALLLSAGWNSTAYYPSLADAQSSLTIASSSSSEFTLKTMAYVSVAVPFVVGYIWWTWRAMNSRRMTRSEAEGDEHLY